MVAMLATALDARPTTPSTSENLSAYGTSETVARMSHRKRWKTKQLC